MGVVSKIIKSKAIGSSIADASASIIRNALFAIGARTTGTKSLLLQRLRWNLSTARSSGEEALQRDRPLRLVSVDMGIRNLAFVVCDVELAGASQEGDLASKGKDDLNVIQALASSSQATPASSWRAPSSKLTVRHWTRIALDETPTQSPDHIPSDARDLKNPDVSDPYHPSHLSRTATTLLQALLHHKPDIIVIERQRHRSGGGAAIQEWTVRVNSLEAMLYSGLRMRAALLRDVSGKEGSGGARNSGVWGGDVAVHGVSPATVAQFWVPTADVSPSCKKVETSAAAQAAESSASSENTAKMKAAPPRRKIEKKDKIAVVASWLQSSDDTPSNDHLPKQFPPFQLSFTKEAAHVRDLFLSRWQNGERKRPLRKTQGSKQHSDGEDSSSPPSTADNALHPMTPGGFNTSPLEVRKLDDLADCLLQAGAWVMWRRNRGVLAERLDFGGVLDDGRDGDEKSTKGTEDDDDGGGGGRKEAVNKVTRRRTSSTSKTDT